MSGAMFDRRGFLGASALGLAASGCSWLPPRRAVAGGQIRVAGATSSIADTLDPARQMAVMDYCRCNMFYDGLTRADAQQRAQPALAEAIDTRDAKTWTIKLRKGVRFHDGRPLTPRDVVYSIRRHTDPAVGSKARTFMDQFADVREWGEDAVRIELVGPNADLPVILSLPQFKIIRDQTRRFHTANGTGPFRCAEFDPGVRSLSQRFDDYWRGPVRLGEVELFAISDESARINALLSGDVDLIAEVNPRIAPRLVEQGVNLLVSRSGGYTDLVMRLDQAPGRSPEFVRAMKLLLDREAMNRVIFRNYATIANDHPIPPYSPYFNADLPQRPYDPDEARSLIRKAGLAGSRVPMVVSSAALKSEDMGVLIQEAASRAGLHIDLRRQPPDGYWANNWMKDAIGFGNINPRPTPDIIFTQFFASTASWNESGWSDARFDRRLLEARGSTDEALRKAIYGEMQAMIHARSGVGIPLFLSMLDAYNPRVKGLRPMPQGGLMAYDFASHVWVEDA
ncbi:ABC transporter substrate-binding protein [Novosphingobium sp. 1949]|uniref:ABC transporter substrate-binding protein n=1 Tax=Novosphingobium organovorum TaxID=2930092 RepID=A0ABT0BDR6_9SPHN|nr:ABC transporter substrate-binding protein [Novosphingobium organovorum]MCJ2182941.1 ABC transporter substrate-binding protein [Novosphingobium organovorum]